jgi:hypothetical protein
MKPATNITIKFKLFKTSSNSFPNSVHSSLRCAATSWKLTWGECRPSCHFDAFNNNELNWLASLARMEIELPLGCHPRPPPTRFPPSYEHSLTFFPARDPPGLASLGPSHEPSFLSQTPVFSLRSACCHWYSSTTAWTSRSFAPGSKSSNFLGDPPPDPRFLASLGTLSLAQLHNCLDRTSRSEGLVG